MDRCPVCGAWRRKNLSYMVDMQSAILRVGSSFGLPATTFGLLVMLSAWDPFCGLIHVACSITHRILKCGKGDLMSVQCSLVARIMQALEMLPTDALRLILDNLMCFWRQSKVIPNLLKLPESFLDVWLQGQDVVDMMHAEFPVASLQRLIQKLPHHPDISVLHLPAKVMETAGVSETLDLLTAVFDALNALPKLTHLGIHGLHLRQEHLPVFTSMCAGLRCKLTGLSLSLKDWEFGAFRGVRYLLEAIGKLSNLEMLAFPRFEEFVGSRKYLLQSLSSAQQRTVFVRGEPSQEIMAAVRAVAPNLHILSLPFDD
jgi:hypothetical protein